MTSNDGRFWCVIPAAGRGLRFGAGIPKQYAVVAGKPVLLWTLERLARHARIAGLVLVVSADDEQWQGVAQVSGKPLLTVVGGEARSDSVLAGLRGLPPHVASDAFVLVHDAARPCVHPADIDTLIELGVPAGGALLAAPVRDTLKRADETRRVLATEPRELRWRALTPQLFRRGELTAALESARQAGQPVSDEAMAMERTGFRPLLVEGRDDNLKLTTPADRGLIEFILLRGDG